MVDLQEGKARKEGGGPRSAREGQEAIVFSIVFGLVGGSNGFLEGTRIFI